MRRIIFVLRLKHLERHLKGHAAGNRLAPFNRRFGDWLLLHLLYKVIDTVWLPMDGRTVAKQFSL